RRAAEAGGRRGTAECRTYGPGGAGAGQNRARISQGEWRERGGRIVGCKGVRGARDLREEVSYRVPDAVQRSSRCAAEPGPTYQRWTPEQQRTTPQVRRAAQHPGHGALS